MLSLLRPFVLTPIARQPLLTQLAHKSTYSRSILKKAAMESNRQRAQGKKKEQRATNAKLRGYKNETPEPDGYIRVDEILKLPVLHELSLERLQGIVKADAKTRFTLKLEADPESGSAEKVWWIRANQGHSMKAVSDLELKSILSAEDIPTKVAVHGTTRDAWQIIRTHGLNKMTRNHIHLAQGVPGTGVISGMRNSSQILIYINVQKALDAGIHFYLSTNGVVLTDGDEQGFLEPEFFDRVTTVHGESVTDWTPATSKATSSPSGIVNPLPAAPTQTSTEAATLEILQAQTESLKLH